MTGSSFAEKLDKMDLERSSFKILNFYDKDSSEGLWQMTPG